MCLTLCRNVSRIFPHTLNLFHFCYLANSYFHSAVLSDIMKSWNGTGYTWEKSNSVKAARCRPYIDKVGVKRLRKEKSCEKVSTSFEDTLLGNFIKAEVLAVCWSC